MLDSDFAMPPVADPKAHGQNGSFCNPDVEEELRQLRWDILALADGFGLTDRPATFIPPAPETKGVQWVYPPGPSRRQKELAELLSKKF
ncbi:hypothetical protein MKX08_003597 [Trichoderma sp. CBMAI-0020]|nr:hypothetical protein MKX08_003597 [Trichoderma sp. CBMAI-0020]